ncbi:portal protein, partial [Streptococcus pyogenes]
TGHESYQCDGRIYDAGTKIKIPKAAVVYAHSGLVDCSGRNIIGYLHRAVKPANQLKLLEDAMVIYRITRAPDRRVFYIDTG